MSQLITLCSCTSLEEALNYKKFLAQNGIKSYFDTQNILETNFDKENEDTFTEINLLVSYAEVEIAREILSNFHLSNEESETLVSSLEVAHTLKKPKYKINCPKCNSNNIYWDNENPGVNGIIFLLEKIGIKKPKYVCYYCGNEFKN